MWCYEQPDIGAACQASCTALQLHVHSPSGSYEGGQLGLLGCIRLQAAQHLVRPLQHAPPRVLTSVGSRELQSSQV